MTCSHTVKEHIPFLYFTHPIQVISVIKDWVCRIASSVCSNRFSLPIIFSIPIFSNTSFYHSKVIIEIIISMPARADKGMSAKTSINDIK
ncbi:MAG: hypothetical protein HZB79_07870 [Deltaproteobacteria bacterium]|nr:hypothetical protein [Deltaproteobacteria bacterium]